MSDEPAAQSYQDRVNERMQAEIRELETPQVKAQQIVDRLWQMKLDAEAPIDDGYVEIGGFRERRTKYGFTKHWRDPDFDMR